jgi:CRP-like cAMP-binding protein
MSTIVMWGTSDSLPKMASLLWDEGHTVTLQPELADPLLPADLYVTVVDKPTAFNIGFPPDLPLLVWNQSEDAEITVAAYAAGVSTVLPAQATQSLVLARVRQILAIPRREASSQRQVAVHRAYAPGQPIHMAVDTVMIVEAGIVAQTIIHQDGNEVLLGLYGPGQLLMPHPEDGCFIHLMAHTEVEARLIPWAQAISQPGFTDHLRQRLRLMEAWSANQARPYLADRVLGLLTLLGEQFGVVTANGLVVDVRITHAQIASAVGAVRTTVTRILGELRRRRLIVSVGSGDAERFCLLTWQESPHLSAHPSSRTPAPLRR